MQAESEILVLLSFGILAMAILVMSVVLFVAMYHRRGIKNKLELEQIKVKQTEELIKTITIAQEEERKRISAQLHDEVGASLSAVGMLIGRIKLASDGINKELAQEATTQIDQITGEVRGIVQNMSPSFLERFGLLQSIAEICKRIDRGGKIKTEYNQATSLLAFKDKNTEIMVYRIIQELTNNVIKHSEASEMKVKVEKDDEFAIFSVSDNGKGVGNQDIFMKKSLGLTNIRSRVALAGGSFSITDNPNGGAIAVIKIPIN